MEYNENDARLGADIKELQPSPGEGKPGGGTIDPLVTDLGDGPRGTPVDVSNPEKSGVKVEQNLVNFLKGLLIKGKSLEEYIDSQGGVTEAELVAALANYYKKTEIVANPSNNNGADLTGLQVGNTKYKVPEGMGIVYLPYDDSFTQDMLTKLCTGKYFFIMEADDYSLEFYYPQSVADDGSSVNVDRIGSLSEDSIEIGRLMLSSSSLNRTYDSLVNDITYAVVNQGTKLYSHMINFNNGASFLARTTKGESYTNFNNLFSDFNSGIIWGIFVSSSNFQGTLLSINNSGNDYSFWYYDSDLETLTSEVCTSIESDRVTLL